MSVARVHVVQSARQRYAKVAKLDEEGKQVVTPVIRKSGSPRLAKSGREVVKRIRVADKSQPLPMPKCGNCGVTIEVGQPYKWFQVGFRGYTQFRCAKSGCHPRPSQLESSQIADVMAAIESAEDELDSLGDSAESAQEFESEAQDLLQQVQDAIEEVASVYEEADEAMGGNQATESYERAETLRGNDLGSFSLSASDPEGCGDDWKGEDDDEEPSHETPESGCAECDSRLDDWREECRDEVREALSNVELP